MKIRGTLKAFSSKWEKADSSSAALHEEWFSVAASFYFAFSSSSLEFFDSPAAATMAPASAPIPPAFGGM